MYKIFMYSQDSKLQGSVSMLVSSKFGHFSPAADGSGLLHSRYLVLFPPPHGALQSPNTVHSPQFPFTGPKILIVNVTQRIEWGPKNLHWSILHSRFWLFLQIIKWNKLHLTLVNIAMYGFHTVCVLVGAVFIRVEQALSISGLVSTSTRQGTLSEYTPFSPNRRA